MPSGAGTASATCLPSGERAMSLISACLEKARQTDKDQKCTITVPAPAQE